MVPHPERPDAWAGTVVLMWLVSCLDSEVRGQRSATQQTGATRISHWSAPVPEAHEEAKSCGEGVLLCFLSSKWPEVEAQSHACAVATHAWVNRLGCPYQDCLCGTGQCYLALKMT